jgi:hypothetical protein
MRAAVDAGRIIACGMCFDVRARPPDRTSLVDAIQVHLEHQNGECVDVFWPHERSGTGEIVYGTVFATKAAPQVFRNR